MMGIKRVVKILFASVVSFSLSLSGTMGGFYSDVSEVSAQSVKPTDLNISISGSGKKVTVTGSWNGNFDYYSIVMGYTTPTGGKGKLKGQTADKSFTYTFDQDEGIGYTYTLKVKGMGFDGSKSSAATKSKKYRVVGEATQKVKKVIKNNITSSMSDLEKVRFVHDWMVKNIAYDTSEKNLNYTFSEAILEKKAVCQGYSETFMVFMELMGIPVKYVPSVKSGNHAWNMVKVSGKWYHIDVTWDDPLGMDDITNNHPVYDFFLQSSESFASKNTQTPDGHRYSASKYPKCSSTLYDNPGSTEGYWESVPGESSAYEYNNTFSVCIDGAK